MRKRAVADVLFGDYVAADSVIDVVNIDELQFVRQAGFDFFVDAFAQVVCRAESHFGIIVGIVVGVRAV